MRDKKQGMRYVIEIDPAKNGQDKRRVLYIYVPLALVALGFCVMIWINSMATLPDWLNKLAGIRDPYETDFDMIAYESPRRPEDGIYEEMVPDEGILDDGRDGYVDCEATNDSYEGYTCDANAPVDICLMDIVPKEGIPKVEQSMMYIKLFNRGAPCKNVTITFQVSDGTLHEGRIKELPSCSSQAIFRWTPKGSGDMKATSVINSDKEVEETSYDNNAKTVKIYVGDRINAPDVDDPGGHTYAEWTEDEQGNVISSRTEE